MRAVYSTLLRVLLALDVSAALAASVDWHQDHIGIPLVDRISTAPVFYRPPAGNTSIITATRSNVLASLNPENGDIVWRHVLEEDDPISSFQCDENTVTALSGPGGSTLRMFEISTGQLLWETRLHNSALGLLSDPRDLASHVHVVPGGLSDVLVLTNAHEVRKISGATGEVLWHWSSEDRASLVLFSRITATPSAVFVVGLTKSFASYTIQIVQLDLQTGLPLAVKDVHSSVTSVADVLGPLSHETLSTVVWLENGILKTVALTPGLKSLSPAISKGPQYRKLVDVGMEAHGAFAAIDEDGNAHVLNVKENDAGSLVVGSFERNAGVEGDDLSFVSGGVDEHGEPYVARLQWSPNRSASVRFVSGIKIGSSISAQQIPIDASQNGEITHATFHVERQGEEAIARALVTTSTGAIQLWQQNEAKWTREESLSEIQAIEFLDLPEQKVLASEHQGEQGGALHRFQKQVIDLQNLPSFIIRFAKRFVTGSYAHISDATDGSTEGTLWRDTFGFKKIIVAVTSTGKVFGIESGRGHIVWSQRLESITGLANAKLFVTQDFISGSSAEVTIVVERSMESGKTSVAAFCLDALTGNFVTGTPAAGAEMFAGSLADARLVRDENNTVIVVDHESQVYTYPPQALSPSIVSRLYLPLRTGPPQQQRLTGFKIAPSSSGAGSPLKTYPSWSTAFPPNEEIMSVTKRDSGPVASFGKGMGDRTTLYKYLNPHLLAVTTAAVPDRHRCSVYLVDTVKGTILFHAQTSTKGRACDIRVAFTENWLVYQYYDDTLEGVEAAKGYRVVSVELYEGSGKNDKTSSSDSSSFTYDSSELTVYHQSFVVPYGVTAMAMTSTRFGITTKDLIVANTKDQIQLYARRFLDPRRPHGKPTAEEQEEMLFPYDPLLPDSPQQVLSRHYQIARTRNIITSPALLESTSLVLAYGLDLFMTRVTPSGTFDVLSDSFNKAQLVLVIFGLGAAILLVRPMVRKNQLKQRWYT
ncbi:hypothetical protein BOTBODRAFT_27299 [Botryobasidium botryosum FD-172 SS1]|uniref:ER membrane protein complex subunit 1 n=1 Tax=Botryobasidium botryosum (strain FD-172 SS1) TaxID=930990 RepID=A0A067MVX3_BOTB1|nr:hypothetical protein BOTBODRAFT_27299 [Botryobasidium botryosum FD-172 SS1]